MSELREPILVVADVIQQELGLKPNLVMLKYEKYNIPNVNGLFIALAYIGASTVIANVNEVVPSADGMLERQSVTMLYVIQIDAMSFNAEARLRKEEIPMALASVFAEQQMELHTMQFARKPSPLIDASSLEETKLLNRFTTTIAVTAMRQKEKAVGYFDTFKKPEVHFNA